jgi:formylglycine-generating enzyme required for sulfatase activity
MNDLSSFPWLRWYVLNMKSIPAGTVTWSDSPTSQDSIALESFRMGATPVTWGMWKEYVNTVSIPSKPARLPLDPGWGYPDDHPVVNVSCDDVMKPGGFCDWASEASGMNLSLPTSAQWVYAAKGGKQYSETRNHPIDEDRLHNGNYLTVSVSRTHGIHPNGYGLIDLAGNVWQWCLDNGEVDGEDCDSGIFYVVRGWSPVGPLNDGSLSLHKKFTMNTVGFRLVQSSVKRPWWF